MIHTVKGFHIVNEAEVDIFLKLPCFLHGPMKGGNLTSASSAFPKSSLYIWAFSVHTLLMPSLKDFEHNLASMWNECKCAVVLTFFGIILLWDWNEEWPFPVLWPLLTFPNLYIECCTLTALSFRILNSSPGILPPPLALFVVMPPKAHFQTPGCLALGEWPHHCSYLGH